MRKTYYLFTALIFCLGILIGVFGHMYYSTTLKPGIKNEDKQNATKVDMSLNGDIAQRFPLPNLNGEEDEQDLALTEADKERIIADYKQGVGILFDAWKAKNMDSFREMLADVYIGEILENHAAKAEKFIPRGLGLEVTGVIFDHIEVEAGNKHSATVKAIYRYKVRDYDLNEEYPIGEEIEHFVHVRANLVKMDSRWLITGETVI
ncbi:MAG: hypothetical protein GX351_01320 [Peptococcaceae bacterium]|jgi:hypothetical protein|nr:hypothetical protein [Peptococcaceae bacterium]